MENYAVNSLLVVLILIYLLNAFQLAMILEMQKN